MTGEDWASRIRLLRSAGLLKGAGKVGVTGDATKESASVAIAWSAHEQKITDEQHLKSKEAEFGDSGIWEIYELVVWDLRRKLKQIFTCVSSQIII